MTIEAQLERIADALEILAGKAPPAPESARTSKKKTSKKKTSSSKTSTKTPNSETAPDASDEESTTTQDSAPDTSTAPGADGESSDEVTKQDVKEKLVELQKKTGSPKASIEILKANGATTIGKLKPENYAAVVAAIDEALSA